MYFPTIGNSAKFFLFVKNMQTIIPIYFFLCKYFKKDINPRTEYSNALRHFLFISKSRRVPERTPIKYPYNVNNKSDNH